MITPLGLMHQKFASGLCIAHVVQYSKAQYTVKYKERNVKPHAVQLRTIQYSKVQSRKVQYGTVKSGKKKNTEVQYHCSMLAYMYVCTVQ